MVGLERLLIGRTLDGRYTIEELIGQGRGGLVYRARHPHTGVEVALKVLAAPRTPEARERFRKLVAGEVRAAAAIEHPNVAGVYCLGHDGELDLDFVASELLRGQTLASVLSQRGKPPIALGLRLLGEAAEGLAAGHRAGLVHRDLRPASLYLVRSDTERQVRVKVAGFGVPQIVRRESLASAAPEVSAYASPELLAAGSLRLGPASDVFSLGVVGYELLTGHLPFDDAARRALAEGRAVEAEPPAEVAAGVPPHVVEAVLHALRCNPAERLADGTALSAALQQQPTRQVVAVGKMAPAAQPAAEASPAVATPEPAAPAPSTPQAAIAAEVAPAPQLAATAVLAGAAVVEVADLAATEPEAELSAPSPAAEPSSASNVADAIEAPAASAETAVAAVAPEANLAVSGDGPPPASTAPAAASPAPLAATGASASVAPPFAAPPPPRPDPTRVPAPKAVPGRIGPAAPDLELYYPPQAPKPAVAAPVAAAWPSAPPPTPAVETPAPVAAVAPPADAPAPVPAAPVAAAPVNTVPVAAAPAYAPVAVPQPAEKPVLTPMPGAARRRAAAAGSGGVRGPAMAAGFVLGILVLGSAAWMATRHGERPAVSAPVPLANQLAQGSAVTPPATPAATPAQIAADAQAAPPTPITAADTANRTAEQRAADRKKREDDERRRQELEKARQAQLLQQQQLAQQARPGAPPVAPQSAPAQPQPQQVAVAQPQRPAPQPVAPPPAPASAPAREETASNAPSSSSVFDEDVVEERPRLTNANELQRALQDRYPAQLQANRVSGNVMASFVVGADGRVDPGSIRIVSSPNAGFNSPTQSVLRRARFRPARVKGQPVRVQVTMPIAWTLAQ
ncbi:MAG TPA: TonB family protein [Longimicrobium sp.]|nr:TonB family protein [Longimicrobium sp.]